MESAGVKCESARKGESASTESTTSTEYLMGFPFPPYTIQCDLMRTIHTVLDECKIGILESPTGTGKSLSLICGTLSWLEKFNCENREKLLLKSNELQCQLNTKCEDKEEDWVQVHTRKKALSTLQVETVKQLQLYEWRDGRSKELNDLRSSGISRLQNTGVTSNSNKRKLPVEEMVDSALVDYESDSDSDKCDSNDNRRSVDDEEVRQVRPKIFYACRTHSQLAQFVSEVTKTRYASSMRVVSLASRSNLCVNPSVNRAKSVSLINDRCTELMNSSGKSKCTFMSRSKQIELRDEYLSQVLDIEDMFKLGSLTSSCPYYAVRNALPEADVVVLPYNILLHSATRQSWGIDLTGSVVIIDEAHNLLETISSVHSAEVTLDQLTGCFNQLTAYTNRYGKQLKAKNLLYIKQLSLLLKSIVSYVKSNQVNRKVKSVSESNSRCQLLPTIDFVIASAIDGLNLFKLINYCKKSQLARKLFGFSTRVDNTTTCPRHNEQKNVEGRVKEQQVNQVKTTGTSAFLSRMKKNKATSVKSTGNQVNIGQSVTCNTANLKVPPTHKSTQVKGNCDLSSEKREAPTSPLYSIIDFIQCLTNPASDGRVLITTDDQTNVHSVRYFLLNSAQHFAQVVGECRSLLLAGGTMQPFTEFTQLLFKPLDIGDDRLITFSCGHVIPSSNILPLALAKGVGGNSLHFSYANRCTGKLIDDTGQTIHHVSSCVPGGVVVFFPSYGYLDSVFARWTSSKVISLIESKGKRVFREPKEASSVAKILHDFSRANRPSKDTSTGSTYGAILLSVVGGKMSEGINFSDEMCRCVIVLGMPYPNAHSLQLQEKMKFYDETLGTGSGKFYYENLCFKAVNQSIGRSIRHSRDYSGIILMDERYTSRRDIKSKLPKWIAEHLIDTVSFEKAHQLLREFFVHR